MKPSELMEEKYDEAQLKYLRENSDRDYQIKPSWGAAVTAALNILVVILDSFDERLEKLEKKKK